MGSSPPTMTEGRTMATKGQAARTAASPRPRDRMKASEEPASAPIPET
ncbi:hypothetical protein OB2597_01572 [Pseudooceanicola batsensis HTCC2597]|uniref:Uncharacterized protein n=1 Tax=Pseudooceanicola batsensis (strain ATCC BAA-863 / DSM 15984 / KCTC 12145 / HTCC2597) TaxID=252305 RepID=A3U307_PSEBH|nr:hypothetical protein OB2597_01572 [Pseudooceanicola batsensis HTCC2597]